MIISGPMVRHANRNEVNIWFASDKPITSPSVTLYSKEEADISADVITSQSVQTLKASNKCYFYLVTCKLELTANHSGFSYDIYDDKISLFDDKLADISLNGSTLPSFVIPEQHTNILQASCRKPHAVVDEIEEGKDDSHRDQIVHLLSVVEKREGSLTRPSQLFLTGDQIYADDVAPEVLEHLHIIARVLELKQGVVPKGINPKSIKSRAKALCKKDGFTSGSKDSHLITLSEFIAMYFFSFGSSLTCKSFANPSLKRFQENTQSVRKLLANISTYMIFDDHEVTDDWNLSKDNFKSLKESATGRVVLTNALVSYFIFQHWGNQPHQPELLKQIQLYLDEPEKSLEPTFKLLANKFQHWGYVLNQNPPVIVLDTRTQREFDKSGIWLIRSRGIEAIKKKLALLPANENLVVVSPTPILGFKAVERVQLKIARYYTDKEPWVANRKAYQSIKRSFLALKGLKNVFTLSGDVHYAFVRRELNIKQMHQRNPSSYNLWQLCSSASHNQPTGDSIGLSIADWLDEKLSVFSRKKTQYLQPEEKGMHFLSSIMNVSELKLPLLDEDFSEETSGNPSSVLYLWDFEKKEPVEKTFKLRASNTKVIHRK